MILRHARESIDGQPIENSFVAIDEKSGATLGSCTVFAHENRLLFPARPQRFYLEIEGEPAPDALLGAAVARAKELAQSVHMPSRIFTQVAPDNDERMESLTALGFRDNDGLVRMRRNLTATNECRLPIGCVFVSDHLEDPIEQKFFLERYNLLYNEQFGFDWLQDFRSRSGFERILLVSPTGMAGEITTWLDGETGHITWLQTAKKWRGMNVAHSLLELACRALLQQGASAVDAEIQVRIPSILRVLERAEFCQDALIYRYPGIDFDPA